MKKIILLLLLLCTSAIFSNSNAIALQEDNETEMKIYYYELVKDNDNYYKSVFYNNENDEEVTFSDIFELLHAPVYSNDYSFNWTYRGDVEVSYKTSMDLHKQIFIFTDDENVIKFIKTLYIGQNVSFITKESTEDDIVKAFAADEYVIDFIANGGPNLNVLKDKNIKLKNIELDCNTLLNKISDEVRKNFQ